LVENLPGSLQRLPKGQDRRQAEMLSRDRREKILVAMAEIVAKRGYQGTTVEHIVKRAGVARNTFYEYFKNREACLLAGFEEALAELTARATAAAGEETEWPLQVRAALSVLMQWVAENPALARTCLVESMTAGPVALERYEEALRRYAPLFALGRDEPSAGGELPDTLEDSIVGGIVWMIHQRLLRGEAEQVPALLPTILEFALGPYLGERAAAEVAATAPTT
jgi:AcrR family transcriptional regulator